MPGAGSLRVGLPDEHREVLYRFNKVWARIRKEAGLSIRFHDLRHTFASWMASSGEIHIYTLRELFGHKSLAMTQRHAHRRGQEVANKIFGNSPTLCAQ